LEVGFVDTENIREGTDPGFAQTNVLICIAVAWCGYDSSINFDTKYSKSVDFTRDQGNLPNFGSCI
jgi:hypothetical protein